MNRHKALPLDWEPTSEMRSVALLGALLAFIVSSCAPVRPEERAVLADPMMQIRSDPGERGTLEHTLENREGSIGGGSVEGGGCGCN